MIGEEVTLTEQLASCWAGRSLESIPPAEVAGIKSNILDTLAVALAGSTTPEAARVASALVGSSAPRFGSTVWGTPHLLPPGWAALANGTAAHARDFDDGGGPGHAGSTVLPAALALAEQRGCDGATLVAATIAGYDIGFRVLQALGGFAAHTERGWHTTGTMGSFAAAAAAARILELDADRFADALGVAGSFTGGIWSFIDDGAMTKRFHPGKAGEAGVDAALLAEAGFTGPRRVFEAEWGGIYAAYNGGMAFPDRALHRLGEDFSVKEAWLKPHACCRGSQSSIDAVLALVAARDLAPADIRRITIAAAETQVNMLSVYPIETVFDAQFSLPYAVSVALVARTAGLDQFDPPRLDVPEVREMFDKVVIRPEAGIAMLDGPRLDVELITGEMVTLLAGDPTNAKGSKFNPMSFDEVVEKAESLLVPFGPGTARDLVHAVERLDQAPDLTELLDVLRQRPRNDRRGKALESA
ncbi:MmgE/PrpD family protein [Pimelobacter simplex]|uniref:MmgE/PrpD family protein n=1 Tax=Nocardioides simplex TaxID=2045 RepID=UPI0019316565|nr:MmgE/PrpD family protein [Pimelobacter simplex]